MITGLLLFNLSYFEWNERVGQQIPSNKDTHTDKVKPLYRILKTNAYKFEIFTNI